MMVRIIGPIPADGIYLLLLVRIPILRWETLTVTVIWMCWWGLMDQQQ